MKGVIRTINVCETLRSMEVGANVFFEPEVNENTLRNTCVRLKNLEVGAWCVDKMGKKGYIVKRIA